MFHINNLINSMLEIPKPSPKDLHKVSQPNYIQYRVSERSPIAASERRVVKHRSSCTPRRQL